VIVRRSLHIGKHMIDKADLRRRLLAQRDAIPADVRQRADAGIGERLVQWWRANPVEVLGVYWPIRSEPDLRPAYETLAALGAQLALPVVATRESPLQFVHWQPGAALIRDAMGIAIPQPPHRILQPQAVLAPCVGFNERLLRIGYGGGFFDRTLAREPRPRAIGIAYKNALVDFDGQPHDIALDLIITD
jgi:5-formyltetrahydrofolate cyclo-ligase